MAKYTIEDIEILRQKSGISYEEAVNLLEYHNGSLARALVDLEKNGRLKSEPTKIKRDKGLKGVFEYLFRLRVLVKKEQTVIINLSSLFLLTSLLLAAHVCVIGFVAALLLGYRISVNNENEETAGRQEKDRKASSGGHHNAQNEKNSSVYRDSGNAASGTKPVHVQFPAAGQVDVRDDGDGYHEADIQ